jgi:two-component system sensor kinase FixL
VAALRQSEALEAAVVQSASDAIVTYDEGGVIRDWNAAAEKIFGYSCEEMVGQPVSRLRPTDASNVPALPFGAAARHEYLAQDKRGTMLPVEVSRSVVQSGEIRLTVALIRDLTEVKQTQARLQSMQEKLLTASREAGMAQVATSVLHNVGNVLNSVNVSATLASEQVRGTNLQGLSRASELLRTEATRFGDAPKLVKLATYLEQILSAADRSRDQTLVELGSLKQNIEHIATIVSMQQSMAKPSGLRESISLPTLVEESLKIVSPSLARHDIEVVREYGDVPAVMIERHKISDILINLFSNARDALRERDPGFIRRLTIRILQRDEQLVCEVEDTGGGIAPDNLVRVFSHGFTTKPGGHGFGLHASALFAIELGGSLSCRSDGPGKGAVFVLALPVPNAVPVAEQEQAA